jgi:hypothetical protein
MMTINFERWLRIPQIAVGPPSPPRRAALAHAACGRPARLAALVGGAAFCASLAMTAAPAGARPAAAPAEAGSTEPGRQAADELSSRRHGAGSRPSRAGRSSGGRGGILGGARGAFKRSVASRGHAGRHHARRPNGEIGTAVSRPKHAGRSYASRQIAGRSRAGPPNFDPRAPGLARLQQGGGARSLGVFGTYRKPHKNAYRHRKGDGFGKYGLQPDGGYSYGSGVGSKKSRHSGGGYKTRYTGGYGDYSAYMRSAKRTKHEGRRHEANYGSGAYNRSDYKRVKR